VRTASRGYPVDTGQLDCAAKTFADGTKRARERATQKFRDIRWSQSKVISWLSGWAGVLPPRSMPRIRKKRITLIERDKRLAAFD